MLPQELTRPAVGLYLAFTLVNTWPRNTYTPLLIGSVLQAVGMGMLAWALYAERKPVIYGMMALAGAGSGFRLLCSGISSLFQSSTRRLTWK